jgi:hypothetical protein
MFLFVDRFEASLGFPPPGSPSFVKDDRNMFGLSEVSMQKTLPMITFSSIEGRSLLALILLKSKGVLT